MSTFLRVLVHGDWQCLQQQSEVDKLQFGAGRPGGGRLADSCVCQVLQFWIKILPIWF